MSVDLDAIRAIIDAYEAKMKLVREYFDRREPVPEEHKAYLAPLADEEVVKAFEALRPLVARVRELERQRDWLAFQHAKACLDAANDACAWNTGDCPVCPLDKGGRCLEVTSKTFIEAAEKAAKEAGA